jgi:hypothetical protein
MAASQCLAKPGERWHSYAGKWQPVAHTKRKHHIAFDEQMRHKAAEEEAVEHTTTGTDPHISRMPHTAIFWDETASKSPAPISQFAVEDKGRLRSQGFLLYTLMVLVASSQVTTDFRKYAALAM